MTVYGPRPALPKLQVGDPAVVVGRQHRSHVVYDATITKVGRAWVDLQAVNSPRKWRMRLDTQNEATGYSDSDSFRTPEQHEWDERLADADKRLRAHGVYPDHASPWHNPERRMRLADLLDQNTED